MEKYEAAEYMEAYINIILQRHGEKVNAGIPELLRNFTIISEVEFDAKVNQFSFTFTMKDPEGKNKNYIFNKVVPPEVCFPDNSLSRVFVGDIILITYNTFIDALNLGQVPDELVN